MQFTRFAMRKFEEIRQFYYAILQVARVGVGAWVKFMYYTLWQEQIIKWKVPFPHGITPIHAFLTLV